MDITELLKGVHCSCGRYHSSDIKHLVIQKDAVTVLRELVGNFSSILLVADENTFEAAGKQTQSAIAD